MGTAASLLTIAVGAIMTWAVTTTTSGFSIHTVGIILMVVGGVGLALTRALALLVVELRRLRQLPHPM